MMVFIGSASAYLYPEISDSDQILLHVAERNFHGIFYGIFIVAMIGVVMSTQDTLLNGAGVSFSQDILEVLKPDITDHQKLKFSKIYTIILGLIAILVASFLDSILSVIMAQLEFYIPVMAPIVFFSVIKRNYYWQSAMTGIIIGLLSFLGWKNFGSPAVPSILVALACNTVSYLLMDYYQKQRTMGVSNID